MMTSVPSKTVFVALENIPYSADILYEYACTQDYPEGSIVLCPFGNGNRKARGILVKKGENTAKNALKTISGLYTDKIYLDKNGLDIAEYMKNKYFCTFFEAAKTIMPVGILGKIGKEKKVDVFEEFVHVTNSNSKLTAKQKVVMDFLNGKEKTVKDVLQFTGVTRGVLSTLKKNGIIELEKRETFRNPLKKIKKLPKNDSDELNPEQQKAYEEILKSFGSKKAHLLYGVTGSGKTHVFMKVIDELLSQNKSVLLLLPEISLTLQIVQRFYSDYGDKLAVLHSALSQGERFDEWKRIKAGDARVVIGTRSAIFAPLKNIGAIIIDEEQEHTYKSDMTPKYNARDIGMFRATRENAFLLLASATPSFESFYRAKEKIISFSQIDGRYNQQPLPKVIVADMRTPQIGLNPPIIGKILGEELLNNLKSKEQSILFMNRRGYNSFVSCPKCGFVYVCPNCGISLTYHKTNEKLACHYCGYFESVPHKCKKCESEAIKFSGYGTQKAEAELKRIFPEMRVLRMDADTVAQKEARDNILQAFRDNKYDVLLGTQMITKGLDFPNVTLVGVISADASLYTADFRSYEKTFSLITQVVGRAGRAEKQGRAVIQTFSPEHEVLRYAFNQDYKGFYEAEVSLRKALIYPPYCDICQIVFLAQELERAFEGAEKFTDIIKNYIEDEYSDIPIRIIRPIQTAVPKIDGKSRVRILIKCKDNQKTRKMLSAAYIEFIKDKYYKDIYLGMDINPAAII